MSVRYIEVHVQTSRMKTYHPILESNGHDSGFVKPALCVIEVEDKCCSRCEVMQALWKL